MRAGVIYVLVNEGLPGARKIGRTVRAADRRAAEITRAYGTPYDFVVESKHVVSDPNAVEAMAHRLLRKHRVKNTEIFYVSAKLASSTVKTAAMMTLHRPVWLRIWHWIILPKARTDVRMLAYKDGSWTILTAIALCGIGVWVVREKPELPNWLPQSVAHVVMLLERMSPN